MWRKCNDNRSVLPFIAAMCNKIMTFLRSCTRSSSCTGRQLFPRINRVMLTIRVRFTLHTQSQTQTNAFKLENLNAFYMSIISNSHSMITFTSGIFPREVALGSGPVQCSAILIPVQERERARKGKKLAAGGNQEKMLRAIFPE